MLALSTQNRLLILRNDMNRTGTCEVKCTVTERTNSTRWHKRDAIWGEHLYPLSRLDGWGYFHSRSLVSNTAAVSLRHATGYVC